jgi:hypothetical protein
MITIIDNFLEEEQFKNLKLFSKTVVYKPMYFDKTKEKTDSNTYGFRYYFDNDKNLTTLLTEECLKKFKYKILKLGNCGLDKRKLTMYKPHTDLGEYGGIKNFYLMIEGITKLNHGIGFYDNNELNTHIGFKENRAVLFDSDIVHSPLIDENTWRTTITIFIKDGNFI